MRSPVAPADRQRDGLCGEHHQSSCRRPREDLSRAGPCRPRALTARSPAPSSPLPAPPSAARAAPSPCDRAGGADAAADRQPGLATGRGFVARRLGQRSGPRRLAQGAIVPARVGRSAHPSDRWAHLRSNQAQIECIVSASPSRSTTRTSGNSVERWSGYVARSQTAENEPFAARTVGPDWSAIGGVT
jgi:hypothetical protein